MDITRQLKGQDTWSSIPPAKAHGAAKKLLPKCSNIPGVWTGQWILPASGVDVSEGALVGVLSLYTSLEEAQDIHSSLNTETSTPSAVLYFTDVRAIYWFLTGLSTSCSGQKRWQESSLQNLPSNQEHHSMPDPSCWHIWMTGLSLPHFSQHNLKAERTSPCSSAHDWSEEADEHSRYSMKTRLSPPALVLCSSWEQAPSPKISSLGPDKLLSSGNG